MPPRTASIALSVKSRRISRPRLAPSVARIANSTRGRSSQKEIRDVDLGHKEHEADECQHHRGANTT